VELDADADETIERGVNAEAELAMAGFGQMKRRV
jgi:hypothetical protein